MMTSAARQLLPSTVLVLKAVSHWSSHRRISPTFVYQLLCLRAISPQIDGVLTLISLAVKPKPLATSDKPDV